MKPKRNGVGNVRRMNVAGMVDIPIITLIITLLVMCIIMSVPLTLYSFGRKTVTGINAVIMEESATRKFGSGVNIGVVDVECGYAVTLMETRYVYLKEGKLC